MGPKGARTTTQSTGFSTIYMYVVWICSIWAGRLLCRRLLFNMHSSEALGRINIAALGRTKVDPRGGTFRSHLLIAPSASRNRLWCPGIPYHRICTGTHWQKDLRSQGVKPIAVLTLLGSITRTHEKYLNNLT